MKSASTNTCVPTIPTRATFNPRKSIRRIRAPQRSTRHTMPSNNQNDIAPAPTLSNQPAIQQNNLWRPDDIRAIAQAAHQANDTDPSKLFGPSNADLPEPLKRKSRDEVNAAVIQLQNAFDQSIVPFAPKKTVPNFLAVLASEINFMKTQREERDSALAVLSKARSERQQVDRNRERLITESKALTKQIQEERARRARASEKKAEREAKLEEEKRKVEEQRQNYELLRDSLEQAKLAELEIRRRLDRMRLKVAAMRGEMIIPTVDKLAVRDAPKWLGDFDDGLISGLSDPKNGKEREDIPKTPPKAEVGVEKPGVEMEAVVATEDIESPAHSAKDDLELEESNEEIEFRLLKNRLAMVEMEAEEWKQCVESERQKNKLIMRSKARLEEELARQKHGSANKAAGGGGGRGASKSASSSAKATAKLRATIRASLPSASDGSPRKSIRKNRKGRPRRALVPELK